jgi:iron complex outermembrane receptor protein
MFQKTRLCKSLMLAFGGAMLVSAMPALAQEEPQRIEITGSAIRRIDAESALPVVVLKKEDIQRSGATSTVDLLQRLSTIQGGTAEANSVGGSTFGFSGVSIHNIGETRTLVLLNGHRLSQFGGQTLTGFAAGFDLNAIPISAIERVEVLTDGASALYGADAIAGVVNFITKTNFSEGDVSIGYSAPDGGAKETRFSFSKGFGNLDTDGYNVMLAYGHDERTKLDGVSRDYAKTGNLVFTKDGKTYRSQNYSASAIAANVLNDDGALVSPYLIENGSCPVNTFRVTYTDDFGLNDFCGFDYVSTLEIYPERKRDAAFGSAHFKLGDHELFAELLVSQTSQVSRIAPVPGGLSIPAGSEYHNQYLLPLGITQDTIAFYRVADLGKRTNDDTANFFDVALGSKGTLMGWDYNATYTHSESDVKGDISGYPGALALSRLRASGLLNPFVLTGEQTPEAQAALDAINYKGYWDGGVAKLDTLQIQGSTELTKLPAGSLLLATGVNVNKEEFTSKPSPFAQGITYDPVTGQLCDPDDPDLPCDQRFGDASAVPPYSADRTSWGVFGELNIPIVKGLEVGAAVRYDHFSDFGEATTGKASFRWIPTTGFLLRGSVGTGFHAPSVPQVNAAPQSYGVTEDPYDCTPELQAIATQLGAQCQPGRRQYDVVAGGNKTLKPEKSEQATLGFRIEPTQTLSIGADLWWVGIKDSFGQLAEATVFANPQAYPGAWTTATDVATGTTYLAWNAGNLNLGKSYNTGLDIDAVGRFKFDFGSLVSQVNATYMLRDRFQQEPNGPYFTALGDNSNGTLNYRLKGSWRNTLKHGPWAHTISFNFRSGYKDAATEVEVLDASGMATGTEVVQLKVKPYYTFDWQTSWDITKMFNVTVGILNIGDEKPPFVLTTTGGQQVGYDGNLYDPRGRTVYINGTMKF